MKKLLLALVPLFVLSACSAPREPQEQWARPSSSEGWCDRYAGAGPGPYDGNVPYYDRDGAPYFSGPRLSFRDPYFKAEDPLRKEALRQCLEDRGAAPG